MIPYNPQTYHPPGPRSSSKSKGWAPGPGHKSRGAGPACSAPRPCATCRLRRREARESKIAPRNPRSPRKRPLRHAGFRLVLHGGQHLPEASGGADPRSRAAGYFLGPGLNGRFTAASQRRSKEWSELRRPGALRIASYWYLPLLLPKVSRKVPTLPAHMACPHAHTQEMGIKV